MSKKISEKKFLWGLIFLTIATVAYAAGFERISKDKLILGTGTTTSKVFEADLDKGSANPKLRFNTSAPEIEFSTDGTTYQAVGAGGSGGSLVWRESAGTAPLRTEELGQTVFLYDTLSGNKLETDVKLGPSHLAGTEKTLRVMYYSPSVINTSLLKATTYLIRKGTDGVDTTTNFHASTNVALTNPATANAPQESVIDLTDGSGEINSVALTAGDILRVVLTRGTDTDTADLRFIPNATEVE